MNDIELTPEEERAIRSLKRLAKEWPRTLMLHGGGSGLSVRKPDEDGRYFIDREVAVIQGIFADGGDGGD